jgi:hypothetical protein
LQNLNISIKKTQNFVLISKLLRKTRKTANKKVTGKKSCAAGFALLNLPKGESLGRSKPETNSSNEQALATHCVGFLLYPSSVELPYAK